jgi:hypothetical protein
VVDRDVSDATSNVHGEEGEGYRDIERDGGVATEDGHLGGIGSFELLFLVATLKELEKLEELTRDVSWPTRWRRRMGELSAHAPP